MEGLIKAFLDVGRGNGSSNGNGSNYGNGDGDGNGYGYGYGIKSINGLKVYNIDNTPTILTRVRGNIAKGYIVERNVYLEPCYVVKSGEVFAHGHTLREAQEALAEKLFDDMPEEARLAAFVAAHKDGIAYPNTDFFDWHHKLTGSCKAGREAFAANHGIDLAGSMTVREFIALTERDYGGATVKKLWRYYGGGKDNANTELHNQG